MPAFDFDKWDGKIESLPSDHRSKLANVFSDARQEQHHDLPLGRVEDVRKSLFDNGEADPNNDDALTASQATDLFRNLQRRAQFDSELDHLRKEHGSDFARRFTLAEGDLKTGMSPANAFKLATFDEDIAKVAESAKAEALKTAKVELRNEEQGVRGDGGDGGAGDSALGDSSEWESDKESYTKQRAKLKRMDFVDELSWRKEHPEFQAAEKFHKDLIPVSRH